MKIWIKLMVVLSMITGLAIFTGAGVESLAQGEGIKLLIAGRDGTYGKAMQLAVDAYLEENPRADIELLKLPYAGLSEKVVIDLKEATGAYDVMMMDDTWVAGFAAAGWIANLTEMYTERELSLDPDIVGAAVDCARYPYLRGIAPIYGLPHVGNVELFVYRKDLFDKYGLPSPPETWDEVLNAAKVIDENELDVHGVVFRGRKGNPINAGFLPIFWSFGAEVLDEEGNPTVNSPEAVAALKFFLDLAEYAPEGVEIYDASDVRDGLLSGSAAIATEVWPAWVPDLDNPEKSQVVGKIEVTVHPGQVTKSAPMIGIWHLAIPEASTRKDAAFDFLLFVTSERMQKRMALEVGLPPTRASLYVDPEVVAKYRWYPDQLKALRASKVRPRLPEWIEIDPKMGFYLNLALVGDRTPEEALNELNAEIADILGK